MPPCERCPRISRTHVRPYLCERCLPLGGLTIEEALKFYETQPWAAGRTVLIRRGIPNTDVTLTRGAQCVCGFCGKGEVCACGLDRVAEGRDCVTCGRPWWCER